MDSFAAKKGFAIFEALVFFSGILMFVGLRQVGPPWKYLSLAGILLPVVLVVMEVKTSRELARVFGLGKLTATGL